MLYQRDNELTLQIFVVTLQNCLSIVCLLIQHLVCFPDDLQVGRSIQMRGHLSKKSAVELTKGEDIGERTGRPRGQPGGTMLIDFPRVATPMIVGC